MYRWYWHNVSHNVLAIPEGYSPPAQLPAEFDSFVAVLEIIDSEFPGFVYLLSTYFLTEVTDSLYHAIPYYIFNRKREYISHWPTLDDSEQAHGPAVASEREWYATYLHQGEVKQDFSVDRVFCCRCLLWPPQAADWPTRHIHYDWPDSATVDSVVSNGCDVVRIAHPLCRHDEWMADSQWRMSFSRAEVVLLNSWTRIQQIVYHMLRVFLKSEPGVETNDCAAKTLSNYHIKTLMLWACELKPRTWWSDDFNVVEICVELLHVWEYGSETHDVNIISSATVTCWTTLTNVLLCQLWAS